MGVFHRNLPHSPGINTSSPNGNRMHCTVPKCTGYSDANQNSLQTTNSTSTKLYSNQSTYGIQFWRTASPSNIEILERFQAKALRMIKDAPWCVPNTVTRKDLQILMVKHEISSYSHNYSKRLSLHPNELTTCQ
jgi:hypothetical protein